MNKRKEWKIRLANGQWLNPCWTPRPAVVSNKGETWPDEQNARAFASQVDGEVLEFEYKYFSV